MIDMTDSIKENCPFKNDIDECQYCGRLGVCYTPKELSVLIKKEREQKDAKVDSNHI